MSLFPVLENDEVVVHYDPVTKQYRLLVFGDAFVNEYWFDEYKGDTISYYCDGTACDGCSDGVSSFCCHTTDIRHAVDFEEVEPGKFIQKGECL